MTAPNQSPRTTNRTSNANTTSHTSAPVISGLVATLLSGAIFGFFLTPVALLTAAWFSWRSRFAADVIWSDYSATWQFWNITRTVFCGISLALASLGLINITVAASR